MKTPDTFDRIYENRLEGWGFSFRRTQLFRFSIASRIITSLEIDGNILDIGCGTSFFTTRFLHRIYRHGLFACDISSTAIKSSPYKNRHIQYIINGLPKTAFQDAQFQLVVALEVLYYLSHDDQVNSVDELHRITATDGYLLISVNIGEHPYFSIGEIEALIKRRFTIVHTRGIYLKTYYRIFENQIWKILSTLARYYARFDKRQTEPSRMTGSSNVFSLLFDNRLAYYTYGSLSIYLCKLLLYIVPVSLIQKISKYLGGRQEINIYFILART